MTHIRQQIRDQAAQELRDAIPEFVEVATSRLYSYREAALPSLNVTTQDEESDVTHMGSQVTGSIAKRTMIRTLQLQTEIYQTSFDESIDDELDRLAVEVEKLMESTLLNDLASDIMLAQSSSEYDAAAEVSVGILTLTWLVTYRTLEGDPETSV